MAAIAILTKVSELDHQHAALVLQFKELCSRQWEVHLSHIYREANNAADYLANLGHSLSYGLHLFDSPDRGLSHWLHYDLIGVSLPHFVRISSLRNFAVVNGKSIPPTFTVKQIILRII
ncbi:Putative ribonuclease H protein At1g65750 [Linum grandiflorum]